MSDWTCPDCGVTATRVLHYCAVRMARDRTEQVRRDNIPTPAERRAAWAGFAAEHRTYTQMDSVGVRVVSEMSPGECAEWADMMLAEYDSRFLAEVKP